MKSCPTCNRTFEDTFTFCLADGSLLNAPFDPQETLVIPEARQTEQPPTKVLPIEDTKEEIPPTIASPQPQQKQELVSTISAPAPTLDSTPPKDSSTQSAGKLNRSSLIMIGVGALLIIGLIFFIVANRTSNTTGNSNKEMAEGNPISNRSNSNISPANQLHIEIAARDKVIWVNVKTDDDIKGKDFILKPDDPPEKFDPTQRWVIKYAQVNATALKVTINNRSATVPMDKAEMVITKDNYTDFIH